MCSAFERSSILRYDLDMIEATPEWLETKTERRARLDRERHQRHRASIRKRKQRWYRKNRERVLKRSKAYREAHPVDCKTDAYRKAERARWRRRMAQPGARLKRREQLPKRRDVRTGNGWLYE